MVKISKRMKQVSEFVKKTEARPLKEAILTMGKFPKTKFDETVELHFHLNLDVKNSEQSVRGTVLLPHGTGRKVRIAVFCRNVPAERLKELGADFVGADDLIEKIEKGFMDFDCAIATPDLMRELSKLGKILGPKGLMPSPKAGTVTQDVERAIKEVKAGKIEFKSDKQAGIHVGIGKRSFSESQLVENANHVIEAVSHSKPAAIKGQFIKSLYLSTTMGGAVKVSA